MNRILVKIIFSLLCFLIFSNGYAQKSIGVQFLYDDAGNRIMRRVIILPDEKKSFSDSTEIIHNRELSDTTSLKFTDAIGETAVSIYPNPNGGRFKVVVSNMPEHKKASIYLHTMAGVMVLQRESIETVTEIDIRNRENGPYILSIEIEGKIKTWKVIKQ